MRGVYSFRGRTWVLTVLALLAAPHARAAGVGLRWDACLADGGVINKSFACNTNSGAIFLVASFVVDQPLAGLRRVAVSLELASASPTLPAWWDMVSCRPPTVGGGSATVVCIPYPGTMGITGFVIGEHGPNTERIEIGNSSGPSASVAAGPEYRVVTLRLNLLRTVGTGSCGGCDIPVCIVVRSVSFIQTLGQPPVLVMNQPLNGTDANYVAWQGGGSPDVGGVVGCPAATAARRSVWGALKALYR
jgi:hypothetical protein